MKKTIIIFFLLLFLTQPLLAKEHQNVGLVAFTAVSANNQIMLSWQTASELDNVGFRLYRSDSTGQFTLLDEAIIPAYGSPTAGAEYSFVDEGSDDLTTAVYKLTEIQINGTEIDLATTTVDVAQTGQPILITIPTNPPINNQQPTINNQSTNHPVTQLPNPSTTLRTDHPITQSPITNSPSRTEIGITIQTQPADVLAIEDDVARTAVNIVSNAQPIVLFQDPTPEGGYPPPVSPTPFPEGYVVPPTPIPAEGSGYVGPTPTGTPDQREPAPFDNQVTVIGDETIVEQEQVQQAEPLAEGQGRLFLWTGFIFGLLIFAVAIYATTLVFTRRSQ